MTYFALGAVFLFITILLIVKYDLKVEMARSSGFEAGYSVGFKHGRTDPQSQPLYSGKEELEKIKQEAWAKGSGDMQAALFAVIKANPEIYKDWIDSLMQEKTCAPLAESTTIPFSTTGNSNFGKKKD